MTIYLSNDRTFLVVNSCYPVYINKKYFRQFNGHIVSQQDCFDSFHVRGSTMKAI